MNDKRLFDYIYEQQQNYPQEQAYGHFVDGAWKYFSTAEMVEKINRTSLGLIRMGLEPGDKVATVVYKTSPEWVILDFALLQIGALNVPMYPTISAREYEYILNESETKYCVVGEGDLYEKVLAASAKTPALKEIFTFYKHASARQWDQVLMAEPGADMQEVSVRMAAVRPDDLATLVYTSGTTGYPKGVMLTHRNIAYNVEAMRRLIPAQPGQRGLSFLPVSHIFERAVVYAYTAYGLSMTFTGTDNLGGDQGDLKTIRPHFFTTVPRLLEKVMEKILAKGDELKGIKRTLFFWAMNLTETWAFDASIGPWKRLQWAIAHRLIFSKWREALGGNIIGIITGASACPLKVMRTFNAAGIRIREGYGMTELAPAASFSRFEPGGALLGTVGMLLEGLEARIDEQGEYRQGEGEILVKSPGTMLGYYKQPEKTAEMIREINGEKWLATGDVGMFVDGPNGKKFLKITDRKKELLKTSLGKYVAPSPIESAFKEHYLVEYAMVVGENLKFVSALLVPSPDGLMKWCQKHGVPWTSLEKVIQLPKVLERYQMLVDRVNPYFGHSEQVKKFTLLPGMWEAVKTDGTESELTPTMKLKRRVIQQKFTTEIEAMYKE
jgi:long-chain acyl-CoA synthetase